MIFPAGPNSSSGRASASGGVGHGSESASGGVGHGSESQLHHTKGIKNGTSSSLADAPIKRVVLR